MKNLLLQLFTWWNGQTMGTRWFTARHGEKVGTDEFGNIYYREKGGGKVHADSIRKERRWVLYSGEVEASRVPAEWHAWLHHTVAEPPPETDPRRKPWQKEHQPNLTGTDQAYRPPGHPFSGGRRDPATGDYEAWKPE